MCRTMLFLSKKCSGLKKPQGCDNVLFEDMKKRLRWTVCDIGRREHLPACLHEGLYSIKWDKATAILSISAMRAQAGRHMERPIHEHAEASSHAEGRKRNGTLMRPRGDSFLCTNDLLWTYCVWDVLKSANRTFSVRTPERALSMFDSHEN